MNWFKRVSIIGLLLLCGTGSSFAQDIVYAFPAGAQQGVKELELEVSGQNLQRVKGALFSGNGITVSSVEFVELEMQVRNARRRASPQLSQLVRLKIDVAPDAEPGIRDLRLVTSNALSNPIPFFIGVYPEVDEVETNSTFKLAYRLTNLPVTVNGQVVAKDRDYFIFQAEKGMHLTAQLKGRRLVPFIADAVPGWFQPIVTLYTTNRVMLAQVDNTFFDPDPTLDFLIQESGDYLLEVRDALHRGRYDFVYRLTLGELPLIKGVFPDASGKLQYLGMNLSGKRDPARDLYYPDLHEATPKVGYIYGRILSLGEKSAHTFTGAAGEQVAVEVMARRLGSPLSASLEVFDPSGDLLARAPMRERSWTGLQTYEADPCALLLTLPKTGTYTVKISDLFDKHGELYFYTLRISPPTPDFELWTGAPSILFPRGGFAAVPVRCFRQDGCTNEIQLSVRGLDQKYTLSGNWISSCTNETILLIGGSQTSNEHACTIEIVGTMKDGDRVIERVATPATPRQQAFAWMHWVPSQTFVAYCFTNAPWLASVRYISPTNGAVTFTEGRAEVVVQGWNWSQGREADVIVIEPDSGISIDDILPVEGKDGQRRICLSVETNAVITPDKLSLGVVPNKKFKKGPRPKPNQRLNPFPALRMNFE